MTPLKKCRDARNLSLPALEKLLKGISGGSKTTLSRLETKPVNNVSKKLLVALGDIFKLEGLKTEHILSPELYSDFIVNYSGIDKKKLCHTTDVTFNEQKVLLNITKQWIESSSITASKFSSDLYEKLGTDNLVKDAPTTADEYSTWKNSALQRVSRILEGNSPLPLSWKHYWLSCLPENIKKIALNQMMANSGYMLVPLPTSPTIKSNDSRARIDVISHQFANVIGGSKPAMDGAYDERDTEIELQLLQDKLMELVASCLRESTVIERCTGVTSKLQQIWANSPLNR
jgi:hypothetical protein